MNNAIYKIDPIALSSQEGIYVVFVTIKEEGSFLVATADFKEEASQRAQIFFQDVCMNKSCVLVDKNDCLDAIYPISRIHEVTIEQL